MAGSQRTEGGLLVIVVGMLLGVGAAQDLATCMGMPSTAECRSYRYPDGSADADLAAVCSSHGNATGCTVRGLCAAGNATGDLCASFSLLGTVCTEVPEHPSCSTFKSLCGLGSLVAQCSEEAPMAPLITAESAYVYAQEMCGMHEMGPGCPYCSSRDSCPSPVTAMSMLCRFMPMSHCRDSGFVPFCNAAGWPLRDLCDGVDGVSLVPPGSTPVPTGGPGDFEPGSCYADPSQVSCTRFLPEEAEVEADLFQLCDSESDTSIPGMSGCVVRGLCNDGRISGDYCRPFSLLADVCKALPALQGCQRYSGMCAAGSRVDLCLDQRGVPELVLNQEAALTTVEMCQIHGMVGCSDCLSTYNCPEPVRAYSTVCLNMDMGKYCVAWKNMCAAAGPGLGPLCSLEGGEALPVMRMYFHYGLRDIVLWTQWIPETEGQYAGTVVAIILMGMAAQLLKRLRMVVEGRWKPSPIESASGGKIAWGTSGGPSLLQKNVVRASFTAVVVLVDYFLMLIAMTFNVGLFIAVVVGFSLGTLCFGHVGLGDGNQERDVENGGESLDATCCDA